MAISFQAHANGVRSAGSSFTIALNSTAGDQIIIAVATPSNGTTVSSITDGGGNAYIKKGSLVNGTTENCELWASANAHPAASGTITVNLSASAVACGCAASYRGVDIVTIPAATSTGSTSPITSGSTTLFRPSAWLVTAGGLAAANAFSTQNGSIRDQITSTAVASVIIDSNGVAGPVTDSATMTAANWSQVSVQLWAGLTVPLAQSDPGEITRPSILSFRKDGTGFSRTEQFTAPPRLGSLPSVAMLNWRPVESYYELASYYIQGEAESGPSAVKLITINSWFGTNGPKTKPSLFSQSAEDVNPGTPIPLPLISGWSLSSVSYSAFNKFSQFESYQPSKVIPFTPLVGQFISSWQSQESYFELENYYVQGDAETGPSGAFSFTVNSWYSTDGQKSLPNRYAPSSWDAPAKFGLIVTVVLSTVSAWTPTIGNKVITLKYAMSELASQVRPTLATLPALLFGLAEVPPKALLQKFALSDWQAPPKFGIVTPAASVLSAWQSQESYFELVNSFVQGEAESGPITVFVLPLLTYSFSIYTPVALPQRYALTSWEAPAKFTIQPPVAASLVGWSPIETYAPKFDWFALGDTATGPAVIFAASFAMASAVFTPWAVQNKFIPGELAAPAKFGITVATTPTLSSWTPTVGQNAVALNYVFSSHVAQINPTLATLPILIHGLVEPAPNALLQKFALTSWDAPNKLNLAAVISWIPNLDRTLSALLQDYAPVDYVSGSSVKSPLTLTSWLDDRTWSTFGKYQQVEIARQILPVLVTLPTLLFGLAEIFINTQPQKYAISSWEAPPKFGLTVAAPITVAGWTSTLGATAVALKYAASDYISQVNPTLATLPALLFGLAEVPPRAQPQKYAYTSWDAPAKFNLIVAAPITVAGWSPTVGQNSVILKYALSDFVNQTSPTLAVLPIFSSEFTKPAQNAVTLNYASTTFDSPPKFNIVAIATPTLSSWSSTVGQNSVVLKYASTTYDSPSKFGLVVAATPTVASWVPTIGQNSVLLRNTFTSFDAPSKFGIIVPTPITVSNWTPAIGQSAVVPKYATTDFVNQVRPTPATLSIFSSTLAEPASGAVVLKYDLGSWAAPAKFGLIFVAPPTIAAWASTLGEKAVTTRYTLTNWEAPPKFGLIVAVLPTIESWTPTIGQNAIPQPFAPPSFYSPSKFGLIFIPLVVITRGVQFCKLISVTTGFNSTVTKNIIMGGKLLQISLFE